MNLEWVSNIEQNFCHLIENIYIYWISIISEYNTFNTLQKMLKITWDHPFRYIKIRKQILMTYFEPFSYWQWYLIQCQ